MYVSYMSSGNTSIKIPIRLSKLGDGDLAKTIEYYTFNDNKCIKGQSLKTVLSDDVNHSTIFFDVLKAFVLFLPALKKLQLL